MKLKFLIVDDDDHHRQLVREVLVFLGHEVIEASNGYSGLEAYMTHRDELDRIITDCEMPRMNGIEFIGKVREISTRIHIILMSGMTDPVTGTLLEQVKKQAMEAGANATIAKGDFKSFKDMVRNLCQAANIPCSL